ncbi:GIY-YIG nuclease family protein [Pseudotenacibaculum haliotis]|uniref:GIY-YIG nuclease family protein n=1 Tax=Pseudotenacibaculum haliotis TaxID=1862138 RepID=A0ABW5LX31_9FLAO
MFYVYVLYSEKFSRTYTGFTNNLERRLKEHNAKRNKSTKAFVPWSIIYKEEVETRVLAREREKYLKSGIGRDFIKTIIKAP